MSTDFPLRQDARLSDRIRDFFYREEVPYSLAIVRIIMPLVILSVMLPRWFNTRELYSSDGAPCPLGLVYGCRDLLPMFSGEVVIVMHSVLILALVASSIGWCTRMSLAVSTVLYVYLNMMDSVSTITKYSVIASHVMLLLTLSRCGTVWSVDSLLAGSRRRKNPWPGEPSVCRQKFPVWPQRLIQLMIGIVYFGAAITKMHTPEFFSGDQMTYWMLSHVNYANPGGEVLSQYPSLVVGSAYFVIVWEMLFLFLAWQGWGRRIMVPMGILFHGMTTVTLGLYVFPIVCCTVYFSFLREADIQNLSARFRRLRRRWSIPAWSKSHSASALVPAPVRFPYVSWAAYGVAMLLSAAIGLGAEHLLDPYGLRRPEGRYTLKEIPLDVAKQWLQQSEPIREKDKVFAFDLGTVTVGDSLANRRRVFKHGEQLIAQVNLNPPHEDMYVECNLHDSEDRLLKRVGSVILREQFRGHFAYQLTRSLPPGEYQLVLSTAGQELSRRTFRLMANETKPDPQTASAN